MKTVLVTGATGGLGHNAVEFLLKQGFRVRATGRNAYRGDALVQLGAQFYCVDLAEGNLDALDELVEGVDAVWHCAALSSPWGSYREFERCNVHATFRLLYAAGKAGVSRFVHVSTPALYFDYQHHQNIAETYRPSAYVNHYASSKALAEQAVQESVLACPEMTHVVLRPRAIFGPHDRVLLPRLDALHAQHNGRVPLPHGGKTVLDLTYVDNVVHAMWLASTVQGVVSGSVYNVTNGAPREIGQVLAELYAQRGKPFAVRSVPYPVLDCAARAMEAVSAFTGKEPKFTRYSIGALAYDMTLDIGKIERELGYEPQVGMEEALRRTTRWMKKNG